MGARTHIKICGLSTPETLGAAVGAGASHVGFVHFPASPRHLPLDRLAGLVARVPARVHSVGLLVDADDDLIDRVARTGVGILQLHGTEPPERVAAVRARFGGPVWKALGVRTRADIQAARRYAGVADLLLFDAKPPTPPAGQASLPGGNGVRFDWRLLDGITPDGPWGLSGGLDAASVREALALTAAPLVDVSSGVETAPGAKSPDRIEAFVKAVRAA